MLEVFNERLFVVAFNLNEFFERSIIICELFEFLELCEILFPAVSDSLCNVSARAKATLPCAFAARA